MATDIRSFRSAELGNSAYLVIDQESATAAVIDPVRDIQQYVELAAAEGVRILWALETHVHNDFVSGARELVASSGARLGSSEQADLRYPFNALSDGGEINFGTTRLIVLATPGHTPEHVAYLLVDAAGTPGALFSGGALMVGTAARTDLFGPGLAWRFAHDLERSLKEKIFSLPDDVLVYPTHGGGSFCAVGAGAELSTTIGAERATNPLATAKTSREFVARSLTAGPYPTYYARMRTLNQAGAPLLGLGTPSLRALGLAAVDSWIAQDALLLDVRPGASFRAAHIPASIAIGAEGNVSGWVGWVAMPERPLVVISDEGEQGTAQAAEAMNKLRRIGYDRVVGFLDGGIAAWSAAGRPIATYSVMRAAELANRLDAGEVMVVVDVREASEWHAGHIPGSVNRPVHDIPAMASDLPHGVTLAVHCGHDFRATLGASLLERAGFRDLSIVEDGWDGWQLLGEPA